MFFLRLRELCVAPPMSSLNAARFNLVQQILRVNLCWFANKTE
jgi:hypothetical protein